MTDLDMLIQDLNGHIKRRDLLAKGYGAFIRREGYRIESVIATYDSIIASIQKEIKTLQKKARK